ncbi:MAG: AraC family transcriptional regulator [Cellvibrionaceae bacterium]|nr:AraC family transcriptional regulator [Cellvibrionaceae bacterium]
MSDNPKLTLELRSYNSESRSHQHDYHQLVLPVVGELELNVGQQEGKVSEQSIALVAAGKEHGFSATENNTFVVADVPSILAPQLEKLPAFIPLDSTLAHYVSFLHSHLSMNERRTSSERQMLLLLIQLFQERYGNSLRLDRRLEAAREYLDQHYQQSLSLSQLATVANLSSRQLNELFCREIGMTPQQYLIEKRMQLAWQLLESTNLSVQQIAERVAYSNLSSFSSRFRKHFGKPPSYFRK